MIARTWPLLACAQLLACDATVVVGAAPRHEKLSPSAQHFSWSKTLSTVAPAEGRAVAQFPDGRGVAVIGFTTAIDQLGRPDRNIYVAALNVDGTVRWSETIDHAGKDDEGFDIVVTAQHELIGAGSVTDGDGVLRGWLRKWSPTGEILATSVAEPDQMLKAKALGLLELEGDVIVAGYANTFERGRDVIVERRTGSTLSLAWSYRYDGPLHGEDEPHRVGVWRSSPIWVTGYQQTQIAAGSELSLLELNPNGQVTWQRSLANAQGQALAGESNGIAVNDIDNVYYLCGTLFDSDASPSMAAIFQLGYRGELAWQRSYPDVGDTASETAALGCSLGSGALTVVGTERENGRDQFWAAKYQPSGARAWLRRAPELASGRGVAAQSDGGAFVTGQTEAGELFVARLVP